MERGIELPSVVTEAVSNAFSFDCKRAEVLVKLIKSRDDGIGEGTVKMGHET